MKKIISIAILLLLIGCKDSDEKTVTNLIIQNNRYYQLRLEEYKLELETLKLDCPSCYTSHQDYYDSVFELNKGIENLNARKTYDTIFERIKILGYENKIGKEIKSVRSEKNELLKNNLYVNLMQVIQAYKKRVLFASTNCGGQRFRIKKKIENDSIKLEFFTYNPFQYTIDSIVDGGTKSSDYISNEEYKVWSIRYKPKSKTTSYHGKIFFRDSYQNDYIFLQTFNETITK